MSSRKLAATTPSIRAAHLGNPVLGFDASLAFITGLPLFERCVTDFVQLMHHPRHAEIVGFTRSEARNVIRYLKFAISLCAVCFGTAVADPVLTAVRSIEENLGAHVGFFLEDLETHMRLAHRADDRFPVNSTFKLFACGALLSQVDSGSSQLTDSVDLRDVAVVAYSPAIEASIRAERFKVTLHDACGMMLSVSDNTSANIVLAEIGGPQGFTAFMRSIGDDVTRLDRWETALNEARPGDVRDTTTPRAIAASLEKLLLGDVLSPSSGATLREWLSHHRVADDLFRSALPSSWSIEDRTGAGGYGSRGIVAVFYPPGRAPIVATLFMKDTDASLARRNAAAARVGRAIVASVGAQ